MDIKKNEYYKKYLKGPYPYVAGAVILGILNIAMFAGLGQPWGVTGALPYWGAWFLGLFGLTPEVFDNLSRETLAAGFWAHPSSVRNLGVIVGAFLSALVASQFKFKLIKSWKQIVAAVLGGLLMGFGAKIAFGCNIGSLFSGTASGSLHGWVFMIFIFLGAIVGGKLLVKYFL